MSKPLPIKYTKGDEFKLELPINLAAFPGDFAIVGGNPYDYTWIYALAIIGTFLLAAATGSNDVANAWATSIGARTLKMWHALVLASIFEFLGAFLLGSRTADVVKNGIISPSAFTNHEDLLMLGMMNVVWVAGLWNFLASYLELNVSTTHSVISAIVGFAVCAPAGGKSVDWSVVGLIIASWVIAPVCTGILSGGFFIILRKVVLRHEDSFDRAFRVFPIVTFFTLFINIIFIMFNAGLTKAKGLSRISVDPGVGAAIALGIAAGLSIIEWLLINPIIRGRIESFTDDDIDRAFGGLVLKKGETPASSATHEATIDHPGDDVEAQRQIVDPAVAQTQLVDPAALGASSSSMTSLDKSGAASSTPPKPVAQKASFVDRFLRQDTLHSSIETDARVHKIHSSAEHFPLRTEFAFGYLQVLTACFASFAHGSNDVGTIVGPLGGVYQAYTQGVGSIGASKAPIQDWILALGGIGLIVGLALYGQTIIAAMGVKMIRITPVRGFCVELAAATIIVIGTFVAIPLSTSQAFIGGLLGVAIAEGHTKSTNWKLLSFQVASWAATLIIMFCASALAFSYASFSPSQYYPLSAQNALALYAPLQNTTKGAPTFFVVNNTGLLKGIYGNAQTGQVYPLAG